MVRIDSNADLIGQPLPDSEIARTVLNLKQRMSPLAIGKPLVDSLKIEKRDKEEVKPTIDRNSLTPDQRKIADLLPGNISHFMKFQVEAWDFINNMYSNEESRALIVSAPTGFGKTEAVIPAVINYISNSDGIAILIFPRRALLLDQLERLSHYNLRNGSIRIGLQMDGINGLLEWTVYNEEQTNISIRNKNYKPPDKINPLRHSYYQFETELLYVAYRSNVNDELKLKFFKCQCGGDLFKNVYFQSSNRAALNKGIRDQNTKFIGGSIGGSPDNTTWECERCHRHYLVSLSREDHIALKPNLIFTTIDSLPSLFSDPDIRDSMSDKPVTIVLDEIHVYYGLYGAHAASILSQLTQRIRNKFTGIGLSATIDKPQEFGKKIFGKDTFVISPENNDKKIIKDAETYYFIKSASDQKNSGEFYSLKSQTMIQFGLLSISSIINKNQTMLAFMDSIDAVSLLRTQIQDAYNNPNKRLHDFRLDGLISNKARYNQASCAGFNPGYCEPNCLIYKDGECWNILRHHMGVTTPPQISIDSVWSSALPDRTTLGNSSVIFSTSELELGIDLPHVEHLVQYGAPFTIFNFLQRKGRAGRSRGSRPNFYFILGDRSNDFVYFSHGINILNKSYSLPLNTDNRIIKDIHKLLNETYDKSIEEYKKISAQQVKQDYVRKYKAAWLAVLEKISPDFLEFLSDNLDINVPTINSIENYTDMTKFKNERKNGIENLKKNNQKELNNLLINGFSPLNYLEHVKQDILGRISSSDLKQNEKDTMINNLKKAFWDVENDIETPDTTQGNSEIVKEHQLALLDLLYEIVKEYFGTELASTTGDVLNSVNKVATFQQTLVSKQQDLRKKFFLAQTLEELEKAIERTLSSEVIKYVFRAQHFYELSLQSSVLTLLPSPNSLAPLPPTNYFSTSSKEVLVLQSKMWSIGDFENISKDISDVIYKYFPFRLNEDRNPGYKIVVQPRIEKNNGSYQFNTSEFLDGLFFNPSPAQDTVLLPLTAKTDRIQDDGVNDVVSFCKDCFIIQDFNRQTCKNCEKPLSKVRIYASPIVDVKINDIGSVSSPVPNMKYGTSTDVMISLKGVELYLRYQFYNSSLGSYMPSKESEKYLVNASVPYGYMINTHSIEIKVSPEKIDYLMKVFQNSNKTRQFTRNAILHTLAHLWVKTISMSTGITDEFFAYRINDNENPSIAVSEIQEGGAGYLEIFTELISRSTNDVLNNMHRLVNCEEHNRIWNDNISKKIYDEMQTLDFSSSFKLSEKERIIQEISERLNLSTGEVDEHFPVCYDGCPYCIGLSGCEQGVEEQFNSLSLQVAKSYVDSLIVPTNDHRRAALMIANGGILVNFDGGSYGIFLL